MCSYPSFSPPPHSAFGIRHSAFTFIEVLFAVILLGIGFIMIAAVFPVAIQQTTAVSDETQGTAIARDAIKQIQNAADSLNANALFPVTSTNPGTKPPQVWCLCNGTTTSSGTLMSALGTDAFFTADRRFAWVGFYLRGPGTSPFAQIFVIALQNPNFVNYRQGTTSTFNNFNPAPTGAIPAVIPPPIPPSPYGWIPAAAAALQAQFFQDPAGNWGVEISYPQMNAAGVATTPNGATGAFVLIATDNYAGRFVRLGATVPTSIMAGISGLSPQSTSPLPQDFYLQPGWDFTAADIAKADPALGKPPNAGTPELIWMIGAAPIQNPTNSAADASNDFQGPFSGPNQDIGVATGFIRVNTTNN